MLKLNTITINNFRFFGQENNRFEFNSQNALIYGENGSGKSSVYIALELILKIGKVDIANEFIKYKNIFNAEGEAFLEYHFTNSDEIRIDFDHLTIDDQYPYLNNAYLLQSLINYKKLLKIHYSDNHKKINLFSLFETLLQDYPIDEEGTKLRQIKDNVEDYLHSFEEVVDTLTDSVAYFVNKLSDNSIKLNKINISILARSVYLEIDFYDQKIETYHAFLNEARLSVLALSVYFASITQLGKLLKENDLRLLVLDDVLISLDMSNRMKLIPILQSEFSDFQIIFLTHDRALFELYKNKLDWKGFELFVDDSGEYEKPLLKVSNSYLDKAVEHFAYKQYDCCANQLRKACEGILTKWLKQDAFDDNCKLLQLNDLLQKAIAHSVTNTEMQTVLKKLQTYRKTIFNPQSHDDKTPVYKQELKEAMDDVMRLRKLLP